MGGSKNVEIYFPATNKSCILPDLPTRRFYHSQAGLRACGGSGGNTTCDTWNPGTGSWAAEDVNLIGSRYQISWTPVGGNGTYLIGGYSSSGAYSSSENAETSDLLKPDGTVIPGFNTPYLVRYASQALTHIIVKPSPLRPKTKAVTSPNA